MKEYEKLEKEKELDDEVSKKDIEDDDEKEDKEWQYLKR